MAGEHKDEVGVVAVETVRFDAGEGRRQGRLQGLGGGVVVVVPSMRVTRRPSKTNLRAKALRSPVLSSKRRY